MNIRLASVLSAFAAIAAAAAPAGGAAGASTLTVAAPIAKWRDAIPLGNGGAGALLWGGGGRLNVTLDRADFWHNVDLPTWTSPEFSWKTFVEAVRTGDAARRDRIFGVRGKSATKLPGVRLTIDLAGGATARSFSLDIAAAVATVSVDTPQGAKEIKAWFENGDTLLSMEFPDGVEPAAMRFADNKSFDALGGYPAPETSIDGSKAVYRRRRRAGARNRFDRDFEAGVRFVRGGPGEATRAYWRRFAAESAVSIPDADMQRLYDFSVYLYGAGARAGNPPMALQGLWTADNGTLPPWNGDYHNDLNTEMTYWGAGPAGKIEALEAFAGFYIERLPECRAFCRKLFGDGADGAVIPPTMGFAAQPIAGWTAYVVPPVHGIWVFDTMCDAWDYDPTPEKAAKYLAFGRELAAGLEHAWKMENGVRRFDVSCSPEVGDNGPKSFLKANSSYERAILASFYEWMGRLAEACGEKAEAAKWRSYMSTFGPPNVFDGGTLEISAGNPLSQSHRHASHLMQVFPLVNVPPEQAVDPERSVDFWERLGTSWWTGYSFAWAGCMEARLGRGDRAHRYLKDFQRAFVSRCGFHLNGDQTRSGLSRFTYDPFTLEGNFGYARGIQEMLMGWDAQERVATLFPALPREWDGREVSFRGLRIPGGHKVSARRAADGTVSWSVERRAESGPEHDFEIHAAPQRKPPAAAPGRRAGAGPADGQTSA